MFKIALVVFRECLEISMVLGIICAATKSIQNALSYITAGIMAGTIAAALLAFFITKLTFSFGGFGEELVDVGIIFLTVVVIGATAIWVKGYAFNIKSKMHELSSKIERGSPKFILTTVVATTILREVTEIIIYMHGLAVSSEFSPTDYLLGFGSGAIMSVAVTIAVYYGLSKIALKYLFDVSFKLLILVAASLASEAAGILTSIGFLGVGNEPLWDSSWLISDSSVIGQVFKMLVGYTAKPNSMQIAFYIGTVILIVVGAKLGERKRNVKIAS
jgi:high-affinity iron transporter